MKIDIEKKHEHEIYDLRLHHSCNLDDSTRITRVPGGWLYLSSGYSHHAGQTVMTFVPFSGEFCCYEENEQVNKR